MAYGLLTKSDLTSCYDCDTQLFYRKQSYPSVMDDDPFMRLLADGGFMAEFIAKARYPDGVDLADEMNPQVAEARTRELLQLGDCTIFEAAVIAGDYYVRVDILRRVGDVLQVIEVKSSSTELGEMVVGSPLRGKRGGISKNWLGKLRDLTFQVEVAQGAYPEWQVEPYLCVVDKTQPVRDAETLGRFQVRRPADNPRARPEIHYDGDVASLQSSGLMVHIPAKAEVVELAGEVQARAARLASLIRGNGAVKVRESIADKYRTCRDCRYRAKEGDKNGFAECWGPLAAAPAHILDLHRVGQIGTQTVPDPVPDLLRLGSASFLDLDENQLGKEGTWQLRRLMQWQHSRHGGSEHLPRALVQSLRAHQDTPGWPLHFVDFEACNVVLPHHAGMRPYERVAFQWSCHTIHRDGRMTHRDWLNTERAFPNFEFAATLRECLGERGTVYVWSPYEETTLKKILGQLRRRFDGVARDDLAGWIRQLIGVDEIGEPRPEGSRIRDLHKLALEHYFHPRMAGRTSIKVVLPAVWENDEVLRRHPAFREYVARSEDGATVLSPYATLEPLPFGDDDREEVVDEGTGAVRVYQELIFASPDAETAAKRAQLLLQYCKLDTAAMVMVWLHWLGAEAPVLRVD